jgi:16S rRNA (cytidine1402-2'-O)-methyltransferase
VKNSVLYIVSTPIGNLEDITIRAVRILTDVDVILSEDTRETTKLLDKLNIKKSQISYRDQNHHKVLPTIIDMLNKGNSLALVSDSGTPLISDPGYKLVSEVLKMGFKVESIPGPVALISALVISGFPTDKFSFLGFLPKKEGQRKRILEEYKEHETTLIIYESPFRILKLLSEIRATLGNRRVCLMSELTKMHEQRICDNSENLIKMLDGKVLKGEYVVLVSKEGF